MRKLQPLGLARGLRNNQTRAEELLWYRLRNTRLDGIKFRRQRPLDIYIVDFISLKKKLIIEIDGGQHNEEINQDSDKERAAWLESNGYRILRFWSSEVLENLDGVLGRIQEALGTPSP